MSRKEKFREKRRLKLAKYVLTTLFFVIGLSYFTYYLDLSSSSRSVVFLLGSIEMFSSSLIFSRYFNFKVEQGVSYAIAVILSVVFTGSLHLVPFAIALIPNLILGIRVIGVIEKWESEVSDIKKEDEKE